VASPLPSMPSASMSVRCATRTRLVSSRSDHPQVGPVRGDAGLVGKRRRRAAAHRNPKLATACGGWWYIRGAVAASRPVLVPSGRTAAGGVGGASTGGGDLADGLASAGVANADLPELGKVGQAEADPFELAPPGAVDRPGGGDH
jgi:hypothetical protein